MRTLNAFWTDANRYLKFGKKMSKKSIPVLGYTFLSRKLLFKEHKNRKYEILRYKKWKNLIKGKKIPINVKIDYKKGIIRGPFRTVGCLCIFWAHIKKARKISIVGMDGYTYYTKKELKNNVKSQHCYGTGFSDMIGKCDAEKKGNYYKKCIKKDKDTNIMLHLLDNYGVKFKILTPTVFEEFCDSSILQKGNNY